MPSPMHTPSLTAAEVPAFEHGIAEHQGPNGSKRLIGKFDPKTGVASYVTLLWRRDAEGFLQAVPTNAQHADLTAAIAAYNGA